MDIKDNYDYNKPQLDFNENPMDNTKLIAQDWWLKPMLRSSAVWCTQKGKTGGYISDLKKVGSNVRVVGTKLQVYNLICKMLDEEGWQIKDSWDAEVKEEYLDLYNKNNKPIIIKLI